MQTRARHPRVAPCWSACCHSLAWSPPRFGVALISSGAYNVISGLQWREGGIFKMWHPWVSLSGPQADESRKGVSPLEMWPRTNSSQTWTCGHYRLCKRGEASAFTQPVSDSLNKDRDPTVTLRIVFHPLPAISNAPGGDLVRCPRRPIRSDCRGSNSEIGMQSSNCRSRGTTLPFLFEALNAKK